MHWDPDPEGIEKRYRQILERIEQAAARAGRNSDDVTLVAVSKTFPLNFIQTLYDCGHRHFGENKVQELRIKSESVAQLHGYDDIVWHMIGHLQRNKAREVVATTQLFHALDSVRLARELDKRAENARLKLECLVQVNISSEESKFGLLADDVSAFLADLEEFAHLEIRGLMAMGRQVTDSEVMRPDFARMRNLAEMVHKQTPFRIGFNLLSMGMSQDFEIAIEEGATHIRLGSAIFGPRECMIQ